MSAGSGGCGRDGRRVLWGSELNIRNIYLTYIQLTSCERASARGGLRSRWRSAHQHSNLHKLQLGAADGAAVPPVLVALGEGAELPNHRVVEHAAARQAVGKGAVDVEEVHLVRPAPLDAVVRLEPLDVLEAHLHGARILEVVPRAVRRQRLGEAGDRDQVGAVVVDERGILDRQPEPRGRLEPQPRVLPAGRHRRVDRRERAIARGARQRVRREDGAPDEVEAPRAAEL
eukprot:4720048-Prymnesium_polylepis.1